MSKLIRVNHVAEMGLTPPDIALPADIDLSRLKEEEKPRILQIGKVGATSRSKSPNGKPRTYGRQFYESLVAEIAQKRPEGGWGHLLDPKRREQDYSPPALRWLAGTIDSQGVAWGLAIPLTKESQDYLRVAELTSAPVGTSFLGNVTFVGNEGIAIELENLDFAHPPRAGVQDAVGKVYVSEMEESMDPSYEELVAELATTQEVANTYTVRVAELEAQVAELQPAQTQLQGIRQFVAEQADMMARMEINISGYGDDLPRMIQDVIAKITQMQGQMFLRDAIDTVAEMVALDDLRPLIVAQLGLPSVEGVTTVQVAEMFQKLPTLDDVKAKVKALMEQPYIQTVAKALVAEQSGPAAIVGQAPATKTYADEVVEKAEEVARKMGVTK